MTIRVEPSPENGISTGRQPGTRAETAIYQALNTPEMLEMILNRLDMRTLLTSAQRVCRSWGDMISKSPSLQRALFFTPIEDPKKVEEKIPNPLLREAFLSIFPANDRSKYYEFDLSSLAMSKDASAMARFTRKEASWRKMLVQQPPISGIGLFHVCHGMMGDFAESSSISVSLQPMLRPTLANIIRTISRPTTRCKTSATAVSGWEGCLRFCSSVAKLNS